MGGTSDEEPVKKKLRTRLRGVLAAMPASRIQELSRMAAHRLMEEPEYRQAETIIDVQKKVAEILGIPLKSPESGGDD